MASLAAATLGSDAPADVLTGGREASGQGVAPVEVAAFYRPNPHVGQPAGTPAGGHAPFKPLSGWLDSANPQDVDTEIDVAYGAGIDAWLWDVDDGYARTALANGFDKAANRPGILGARGERLRVSRARGRVAGRFPQAPLLAARGRFRSRARAARGGGPAAGLGRRDEHVARDRRGAAARARRRLGRTVPARAGHRDACLPWIERFSPAALVRRCTPSRAPKFFLYCHDLPPAGELPKDPTHAGMFGVKFAEICASKGIFCERDSAGGSLGRFIQALCQ